MEINFLDWFQTFGALVAGIILCVDWFIKLIKKDKPWIRILSSSILGLALCTVGFLGGYGMFADYVILSLWEGWLFTFLTALFAILCSVGFVNVPGGQKVLDAIITIIKFIVNLIPKGVRKIRKK